MTGKESTGRWGKGESLRERDLEDLEGFKDTTLRSRQVGPPNLFCIYNILCTHVFLFQQQKLIFCFLYIICETGNDDRIRGVEWREPYVHPVGVHEFPDGSSFGANQTAVNSGVNGYLYTHLLLLPKQQQLTRWYRHDKIANEPTYCTLHELNP